MDIWALGHLDTWALGTGHFYTCRYVQQATRHNFHSQELGAAQPLSPWALENGLTAVGHFHTSFKVRGTVAARVKAWCYCGCGAQWGHCGSGLAVGTGGHQPPAYRGWGAAH